MNVKEGDTARIVHVPGWPGSLENINKLVHVEDRCHCDPEDPVPYWHCTALQHLTGVKWLGGVIPIERNFGPGDPITIADVALRPLPGIPESEVAGLYAPAPRIAERETEKTS
jgi:hypothetical protein